MGSYYLVDQIDHQGIVRVLCGEMKC